MTKTFFYYIFKVMIREEPGLERCFLWIFYKQIMKPIFLKL